MLTPLRLLGSLPAAALGAPPDGGEDSPTPARAQAPDLYHPPGMFLWDTWYLQQGEVTYLYHLQIHLPETDRPEEDHLSIGHATSRDLIHWTEQPVALRRGPAGAWDDRSLYTGYTVEHEGVQYLFYAGNHQEEGGNRQTLHLATSQDGGQTFARHPANPVLEPKGPHYYAWEDLPLPFDYGLAPEHTGTDCRDLAVVRDPQGPGWIGYVVMRCRAQTYYGTACIGLCRSLDLVRWELGPPCFTPDRYGLFEVPDVFELDGQWYLIALAGDFYEQRNRWSDPYLEQGTLVAQADTPEGPFREVPDNLLLAAQGFQGYSARTVLRHGERLMLYSRAGRLSWPVKLIPRAGGGLLPTYWRGVDQAFEAAMTLPDQEVSTFGGWDRKSLPGLPQTDAVFQVSATVDLGSARAAGVAVNCVGTGRRARGLTALLDAANGEVALLKNFAYLQRRRWPVYPGHAYRLRLLAVKDRLELYVDDVLALQTVAETEPGGQCLYAEEGEAHFRDLTYRPGRGEPA